MVNNRRRKFQSSDHAAHVSVRDDNERYCGQCRAVSKRTKQRCKNRTCITHPYCYVHLKSLDGLRVTKSKIPGAGLGLFTLRDIKSGGQIAAYTGKMRSADQLERIYPGDTLAPYALTLDKDHTIDANSSRYSVARYANSCDHPRGTSATCKNNARFVVDHRTRTARLAACGRIAAGDEITVSYGPEYTFDGVRTNVIESSRCSAKRRARRRRR